MKRKLVITVAFALSMLAVNAQGVLEGYKYSQRDLRGTARYMSLGGAMGARGGDISAVAINPAGIGMYKSSEIVATLDLQNVDSKTEFLKNNTGILKDSKFNAKFNNLGFVSTIPIYNDVAPLINFGFSYNKVMSFDRQYSMKGDDLSNTLTEYMAARANNRNPIDHNMITLPGDVAGRDDVWNHEDWLPVLGFNSGLIAHMSDKNAYVPFDNVNPLLAGNNLFVREKGSINTYDFNVGTTFADMISAGLTVSVTDLDYKMSSAYTEEFMDNSTGEEKWNGYDLYNDLWTEGTGWKLGLGVIFKPVEELRIGIAYQSPTWYNMTDNFYADLEHNLDDFAKNPDFYLGNYQGADIIKSMDGDMVSYYKYKLRTPDKWTFSLSGAIGNIANISVDYELVDYTKSKFKDIDGNTDTYLQDDIKNFYRLTSTVRAGVELSFSPKFFGRVGYSWQQSPYSSELRDFLNPNINKEWYFDTPGSVPHYVVEGNTNYITWGLGYRLTRNFYADLAFVYKHQEGDLYTHSMSDVTKLTHNSYQGALTLGFRF